MVKKFFFLLGFVVLFFFVSYSQDKLQPLPLSHSDSAKIFLHDSLYRYYSRQGDYREASKHLDEVALIFWRHNIFDQAIKYYNKSIQLNEKIQNYDGRAKINTNLALIYFDKGQYDSAYKYFDNTLSVRRALDQKAGIISALINQSVVLNKLGKYKKSVRKLSEALTLARELNDLKQMRSCYGMLAETYQKAGNADSAMYYYKYFKTFNDYLTEQEVSKTRAELEKEAALRKVAELEALTKELLLNQKERELGQTKKRLAELTKEQQRLYDSLSKKELVLKVTEQQSRITNLENQVLRREQKRKNIILLLSFVIILSLIVLGALLVYSYRKQRILNKIISEKNELISKQKKELELYVRMLEDQNQRIRDSINYTQNIQRAIFSRNLNLRKFLADYFEIYLPKDIVSGDFIFSTLVDDKIFLALGDCTGHGVPGAFLTIIGYNILNYIIHSEKVLDPEKIMLLLNQSFYEILNQAHTLQFDTLEAGLCVIDTQDKSIEFVGKNINLILSRSREHVELVRGDRYTFDVFSKDNEKRFNKVRIEQTRGVWFYLYSDGAVHQTNERFEKFSIKRLKKELAGLHDLDGQAKKLKLMKTITRWWENSIQLDDITIIGFKIH